MTRFVILAAGVVCLIIVGALGYHFIEGWSWLESFYMIIITLTTVGFGEVRPLSEMGRLFTAVLIIVGVWTVLYTIGSLTEMMVEGRIRTVLGRRKVEKDIEKLEGHYIVCGCGRVGRVIIDEFQREGLPYVVIEKNEEVALRLREKAHIVLVGDATEEEILLRAGILRAKGLVTVMPSDAENLYVTLTSRHLKPELFIVSRAEEETALRKLEQAGADRVVSPHHIGGLRMAQAVLRPAMVSFVESIIRSPRLELSIEEVAVSEDSPISKITLAQSAVGSRLGVIIIGVRRGDGQMDFNPSSDTIVYPGDRLVAMGRPEQLRGLEELAGAVPRGGNP